MIPQRIYLQGILCYRGEQELLLADSSIWLLSGPNGSGKSAVFDAVTFVLFGCHRGGKSNARDLINKHENGFVVEFDFLLDGELFRLRRTVPRKGVGTRQVRRCYASGERKGTWEAVPDTDTERGYDQWVREHIGLTYESFTSSVLLLQGQAERVLSPKPSDRREVLESIVDLNRYRRLYERVDERRKQLHARVEVLGKQLEAIPAVRNSEWLAAQGDVDRTRREREEAFEHVEQLQSLKRQAEHFAELEKSLLANRVTRQHLQGLLINAQSIESGWHRLQELRNVIPQLKSICDQRTLIGRANDLIDGMANDEQRIHGQIKELDDLIHVSLGRRRSISASIVAAEQRLEAMGVQLCDLSELLGRIRSWERQCQEVAELERRLAAMPCDIVKNYSRIQREQDELLEMKRSIAPLTRLCSERDALREVTLRLNEATENERESSELLERLNERHAEKCRQREMAFLGRQRADRQATEARTLHEQAIRQLQGFCETSTDSTCSLCGQRLSAAHVETEKSRLDVKVCELQLKLDDAVRALTSAEAHEQQLAQNQVEVERLLQITRVQVNEWRLKIDSHRDDQLTHVAACQSIYCEEFDDSSRCRVGSPAPTDWLASTYPSDADVKEMRTKSSRLSSVTEAFRQATSELALFQKLQDRAECLKASIAAHRKDLPADPSALRVMYEQVRAEELHLKRSLAEHRSKLTEETSTAEKLGAQWNHVHRQLAVSQAEKCAAQRQRGEATEFLLEQGDKISRQWQTIGEAELQELLNEMSDLSGQDLESQCRELQQAQASLTAIEQSIRDLECRLHQIMQEARQPVSDFERLIPVAKERHSACDKRFQDAQLRADRITQRLNQRQQLRQEYLELSKEHKLYQILAELLGPRRLQREVMRRAEDEIVDLANVMLDRVSGGQLELSLGAHRDDELNTVDKNVLHLEARNRSTSSESLGVAFLSGSQRFRVAVSLALGLGQYASARRRSIQSVIIDEGFGSLDREGRQIMIQELQNLRGYLDRIILVSHQEEFADAFPDGYRFELKDGATQVSRFRN